MMNETPPPPPPPPPAPQTAPIAMAPPEKRLGFVFDIDGTLIAESDRIAGIVLRPGVVEFLKWLIEERGHAVALWTAAGTPHANRVAAILCQQVQQQQQGDDTQHKCQEGQTCSKTFDFVWDVNKLRFQRSNNKSRMMMYNDHSVDGCRWCQMYKSRCQRCICFNAAEYCPCRYTKDLSKVWNNSDHQTTTTTTKTRFTKERTLMVENTPQVCIWNYGNAIYVPTYRGHFLGEAIMFQRLRRFVLELEQVDNVRLYRKCSHRSGPHACFEQDWWEYPVTPQCIPIPQHGETTVDHIPVSLTGNDDIATTTDADDEEALKQRFAVKLAIQKFGDLSNIL